MTPLLAAFTAESGSELPPVLMAKGVNCLVLVTHDRRLLDTVRLDGTITLG